jgi:hypothetical protein
MPSSAHITQHTSSVKHKQPSQSAASTNHASPITTASTEEAVPAPPLKQPTGQHVSSSKKESLESLKLSRAPKSTVPIDEKNLSLTIEIERLRALLPVKDARIAELDEENFSFRHYINGLEQEAQRIRDRLDMRERDLEVRDSQLEALHAEKEELMHKLEHAMTVTKMNTTPKTRSQRNHEPDNLNNSGDDEEERLAGLLTGEEDPLDAIKLFIKVNEKMVKYQEKVAKSQRLFNHISEIFSTYLRSSSATNNQSNQSLLTSRQPSILPSRAPSMSSSFSVHTAAVAASAAAQSSNAAATASTTANYTAQCANNKKRRTTRRSSQLFNNNSDMGLLQQPQQPQTSAAAGSIAECSLSTSSSSSRFSDGGDCIVTTLSPNSMKMLNHQSLKTMQQRIDMRPVLAIPAKVSQETLRDSSIVEDDENEPQQLADQNIENTTNQNDSEVRLFIFSNLYLYGLL